MQANQVEASDLSPVLRRRVDIAALPAALRAEFEADPAVSMTLRARELEVEQAPSSREGGEQVAAFFDIDGTLLKGSIVGHMVRQGIADGRVGYGTLVLFFFFIVLYKLNLIPRNRMYRWGYGLGAGIPLGEATEYVKATIQSRILPLIYAGARDIVEQHRAQGHRLVAVTGAPDYAAAQVAHGLGFDDVLATPTPIDGMQLGVELAGPLCYADGKIPYVHAYAAKHDIDLARSHFYSDSRSDLPLLERVGQPTCVNPQLLLRLAAWRRGWPVIRLRDVRG